MQICNSAYIEMVISYFGRNISFIINNSIESKRAVHIFIMLFFKI